MIINIVSRIKRILLLIRCLIRAVFYGSAKQIPKDILKIMIIPDGKLGDVVCTTPVLHAVRKYFPNAYIIVAGNTILHKSLLGDSKLVDEYLSFQGKGSISRIKKHKVDVAITTGPSFVPVALMYLAGIPFIIAPKIVNGFSLSETRPYKILQRFIETFPYQTGKYAPRERLRALESLDIFTEDTTKHLAFSAKADVKAEELFSRYKGRHLIGISPSAGNKIKEWPIGCFVEVADYVASKYNAVIVIIGGPNDTEYSKKMIDNLNKNVQYIDTTGILSIDELKALISKLNLFISVDTGPIYIAEAFNVPTIDITGPIDEREQPPISDIHKVITPSYRKKPELFVMNARLYNKIEARRQIESITVDMVVNIIEELYPLIKK